MKQSPYPRHTRLSHVVLLLEVGAVLVGAVLVGVGTWIACMVVGVLMDVIAFPFPDRTSYPYETAWLLGSVVLAVVSAAATWRGAR